MEKLIKEDDLWPHQHMVKFQDLFTYYCKTGMGSDEANELVESLCSAAHVGEIVRLKTDDPEKTYELIREVPGCGLRTAMEIMDDLLYHGIFAECYEEAASFGVVTLPATDGLRRILCPGYPLIKELKLVPVDALDLLRHMRKQLNGIFTESKWTLYDTDYLMQCFNKHMSIELEERRLA